MRLLLDNNLDPRLRTSLVGHEVFHCRDLGWADLQNGELVSASEEAGYDALLTGDKNMRYQQNLRGRRISILTLGSRFIDLPHVIPLISEILTILTELPPGSFVTVGGRDEQ